MKILHIVNSSVEKNVGDLMNTQEKANEVKLIKMDSGDVNYESLIDEIENADKVISWLTKS